ncbi:sulfatase family protein [Spirosoma linguale]|uniref:Sulfatase n=1 Tax=Spirosoma linguale (strain ATCC 33905 / DSM 74 / LMG 10896 / Claus 1) TaxID=504472 RepID=D2QL62_SPILD|nr:sulfatase [Spirosoma linguale DSM 74]
MNEQPHFQPFPKKVLKRLLLSLIVLAGALGLRQPIDPASRPPTAPNIIFLLADDQRWDALGVAGNKTIQTPNLDRLAREGFYFRRSYVTTPICCISRASILSGQYARRHGIVDFVTPFTDSALAQTYPALLRKAGYRTGFIGKYGVGNVMPINEYDYWRGFDGQGNYAAKDAQGKPIHLTDLMGQQMDEFLQGNPAGKPFCLSVSFKAPHAQDAANPEFPYAERFTDLYRDQTLKRPAAADDKYYRQFPDWFRHNDQNESRIRWSRRFATDSMFQQTTKSYNRLITGIDDVVGNLRRTLQERGLADNTIIIYTSDNGFYEGEYGFADKWYGHELSIRVPLIIYDPRQPNRQGRTTDKYTLNIDFAPTLLTLAGVPVPGRMQGRSLTQLMDARDGAALKTPWRTAFYFEHMFNTPAVFIPQSEGVLSADRKYVHYYNLREPADSYEEVYNLKTDPLELRNLAVEPTGKAAKKSLLPIFDQLKEAAR